MSYSGPTEMGSEDHKREYLEYWHLEPGSDRAEKAWKDKLDFMQKRNQYGAPMVMTDIAPYVSQIDGSVIESRSKHRAHLKQHGCFEIGNETKYLTPAKMKAPGGLKEDIIEQFNRRNM